MNNESAWEKFKKSGRVLDYLSYRTEPKLTPDLMQSDDSIYTGAQNEIAFKWNNYPGNGPRRK